MKIIASLLFLLLATSLSNLHAQQFAAPNMLIPVIEGNDTLSNAWAGGLNAPLFSEIDLDLDGIKDLFVYDFVNNRISTYINNGNSTNPFHYEINYINKFPSANSWVKLYDFNCDGKEDFFTLSPGNSGISVFMNTSSASTGLQFTLVVNTLLETQQGVPLPFNVYANAVSLPAFSDIDNDGDMDILGYNTVPDGRIVYHKNYSQENFSVCDSLKFKFETGKWGKFQMQVGANEVGCFNCRLSAKPSLSVQAIEPKKSIYDYYRQSDAARIDDTVSSIFPIDLDGDNDKEVLIGDIGASNTLMVHNAKTSLTDSMDTQDIHFPSFNTPINIHAFTYHAYIDCDNDGKKDLMVSPAYLENKKCVWVYKNTGTNNIPVLNFNADNFLVNTMLDVGEGASPVFFDHNNDGLLDLVIGNYGVYDSTTYNFKRGLTLYENIGTATHAAFKLISSDYAGVISQLLDGPVYPSFGDMDNDGDHDMIVGNGNGYLYYFENTAVTGQPASFVLVQANYFNIDVGTGATPQIIDLNKDGVLDIVSGEQTGILKYYQNSGTATSPVFTSTPTIDTLGGINLQTPSTSSGFSVPFFYEENGQYNLWASCMLGDVYKYTNISGNLNGTFILTDTLVSQNQGYRYSYNLSVSGGDIDSDGVMDMALGIYGGGLHIYTSNGPNSISKDKTNDQELVLFPNPTANQLTLKIMKGKISLNERIEIYNNISQIVAKEKVRSHIQLLDVSHLPEGVYFLRLFSDQKTIIKKFVICR